MKYVRVKYQADATENKPTQHAAGQMFSMDAICAGMHSVWCSQMSFNCNRHHMFSTTARFFQTMCCCIRWYQQWCIICPLSSFTDITLDTISSAIDGMMTLKDMDGSQWFLFCLELRNLHLYVIFTVMFDRCHHDWSSMIKYECDSMDTN